MGDFHSDVTVLLHAKAQISSLNHKLYKEMGEAAVFQRGKDLRLLHYITKTLTVTRMPKGEIQEKSREKKSTNSMEISIKK